MSTRLRSTLTLLTSAAMLCVWSGSASADDTLPLDSLVCEIGAGADCETTPAPPPGPEQAVELPPTGLDDEVGGPSDVPAVIPEPLAQFGTEDLGTGTGTGTGTNDDAAAANEESPGEESSDAPDPAEFGTCVEAAVTGLVADLEAAFGGAVEDLAAQIQAGLTPELLLDPAALETFLSGLPALGEAAAEDIAAGGEAIRMAVEGVVACLPTPAPPAEEEPTSPAGPQQPAPPAVRYENCDDARAQGAAPVHAGEPGYRAGLDRDGDGVGCEENQAVVTPVSYQNSTSGTLAYTGFELGPQLAAGGVLLLLGSGLLMAARRRA